MKPEPERVVRKAIGSGRWFPGESRRLRTMIDEFLDEAEVPPLEGRVVAAISPHAGYVYSGAVAGWTFRAVRDQARAGSAPDTVVVLGFGHRGGFPGVALMDGDAVLTPLGETPLDKDATAFLASQSPRLFAQYEPHAGEHSAENQIPFVQAVLPRARLVVGLIGDHDQLTLDELVKALQALSARTSLLVVSSTDLLHDADHKKVGDTDRETLKRISEMDHAGLAVEWGYANQVCCGIGPVLTAMRYAEAKGCRRATVLRYRNSGDDHPESRGNWVVGYGAVVFCAPGE